jgi:hypothetical protein
MQPKLQIATPATTPVRINPPSRLLQAMQVAVRRSRPSRPGFAASARVPGASVPLCRKRASTRAGGQSGLPRFAARLAKLSRRAAAIVLAGATLIATALLVGCGSALSGATSAPAGPATSSPSAKECTGTGLAIEDIAGQCRTVPTTMGALEAGGTGTGAASLAVASLSTSPELHITWQPLAGDVSGYVVYFGHSADTANVFVSDWPINSGLINAASPEATYEARDLGLYPGDTACFRIYGYDIARALSDRSMLVCTVV